MLDAGSDYRLPCIRACRQLIPMIAETSCTAARNVDFSLSYRVAMPLNCFSLAKNRSISFLFL